MADNGEVLGLAVTGAGKKVITEKLSGPNEC